MIRPSGRQADDMRAVSFTRNFTKHAEGSVLVAFGDTKVLCNATVEARVPRWMKAQGKSGGWVTAEYGMLPRSTNERMGREAVHGKQGGRTMEIQRLIGRSLRAAIDLDKLGEFTITIDCDVLQADGGTRTASISGGWVALHDAIQGLLRAGKIATNPMLDPVASVSVGVYRDVPVLDLDYAEDSDADTDMNIVMNGKQEMIELQGTAEAKPFNDAELQAMMRLAHKGIGTILAAQAQAIAD